MLLLKWMIELGRIHISTKVSMLSSLIVSLSNQGYLEAAWNMISYLSLHHNSRLCVDPTDSEMTVPISHYVTGVNSHFTMMSI